MRSLKEFRKTELVIEKSRFIACVYRVKNLDDVNRYLKEVKEKYSDANHYCYAYIIDDLKKSSDDGEPGGTAGVPIMEILLKNDLNFVLCVVTRYFGGIKLGASGLVRAYAKACKMAITDNTVELIPGQEITFTTDYQTMNSIDYFLKDYQYSKEYLDKVKYTVYIPNSLVPSLNKFKIDVITCSDTLIENRDS